MILVDKDIKQYVDSQQLIVAEIQRKLLKTLFQKTVIHLSLLKFQRMRQANMMYREYRLQL